MSGEYVAGNLLRLTAFQRLHPVVKSFHLQVDGTERGGDGAAAGFGGGSPFMELGQQPGLDLLASLVHVGDDPLLHLDKVLLQFRIHSYSVRPAAILPISRPRVWPQRWPG